MRRWVRASTAYDRTTAAPTTGSEIAESSSPTWRRTVPYAAESLRWKYRRLRNSGAKQTHTTIASCQL